LAGYSIESTAAAAGIKGDRIIQFETSGTGLTPPEVDALGTVLHADWFGLYKSSLRELPQGNSLRRHVYSKLCRVSKDWFVPEFGHWSAAYELEHEKILTPERTQNDLNIIIEYLPPSPASILDAACGGGRIALELASLGHHVTAVDLNPEVILSAEASAVSRGVQVVFVNSDLLAYPCESRFDVVLNIYTSIGYYLEENDNWRLIGKLCECVRPGGKLILEIINPFAILCDYEADDRLDLNEECSVQYERFYDSASARGFERITHHTKPDGKLELLYSVRVYYPHELALFAQGRGFSLIGMKTGIGEHELPSSKGLRLWLVFERSAEWNLTSVVSTENSEAVVRS
jgi:2-polyprenyl-3-methyl-5-hydroxy-6-metoxy-1,4-benzoquinol methylase